MWALDPVVEAPGRGVPSRWRYRGASGFGGDGADPGRNGCANRCAARARLPTLMSVSVVVNQAVAAVCQFTQHTDPRCPFWYFSVDSAVLVGVVAALTLWGWRGRWCVRARLTSVVGVWVSAIVFAAVIAPATQTGTWFQPHDDLRARAATVLMHGVAPIIVTLDGVLRNHAPSIRGAVLWSYPWPLSYLGAVIALALIFGSTVIPYPFLRPAQTGWPVVLAAIGVLTVLVGLSGAALGFLCRARAPRTGLMSPTRHLSFPRGRSRDPRRAWRRAVRARRRPGSELRVPRCRRAPHSPCRIKSATARRR